MGSSNKQGFAAAEQGLGQQDAELVVVGERGHEVGVAVVGQADAAQDFGGFDLGHVAVLVGDDGFQVAEALHLGVGEVRQVGRGRCALGGCPRGSCCP